MQNLVFKYKQADECGFYINFESYVLLKIKKKLQYDQRVVAALKLAETIADCRFLLICDCFLPKSTMRKKLKNVTNFRSATIPEPNYTLLM